MSGNMSTLMAKVNGSDDITTSLVLEIIVFTPFVLAILLVAIVSNLILLALIFKTSKVNSNTNIYLFSIGLIGLIGCFNTFTLLVTLFARKWVLGTALCIFNNFAFRLTIPAVPLLHVVLSYDRYKAVLYPLTYWKKKRKTAILVSVFLWVVSFVIAVCSTAWSVSLIPDYENILGPECYYAVNTLHNHDISDAVSLAVLVLDVFYFIAIAVCSIVSLVYYVIILRELHIVESLRTQYRMLSDSPILKVNGRDKPIQCSMEERTAKSLFVLFGFRFACLAISAVIAIIHATIEAYNFGLEEQRIQSQFEDITVLFIFLLPTIGPALLIISNKRYRKHVRGLFQEKYRLENNDYTVRQEDTMVRHAPSLAREGIVNKQLRRSMFVSEAYRTRYMANTNRAIPHHGNFSDSISSHDERENSNAENRCKKEEADGNANNNLVKASNTLQVPGDIELHLTSGSKLELPGQVSGEDTSQEHTL